MGLRYGSLFTGVGGIDLGFDQAHYEGAFQAEIDDSCQRVLKERWPDVPRFDDVKDVTVDGLRQRRIGPVDVLVGGFPCQDISLAGRRNGLAGQRSGLFYEFMRVASELTPRWLLIENVPGLLSAACAECGGEEDVSGRCLRRHGGAMGAVLGSMGNLGYGFAYRMLDAQHFGLAQRRKRIFIVGHLGEPWSAAASVLLEPESCGGDPPKGAGTRADPRSRSGIDPSSPRRPTHDISPCLQERGGKGADSDMTQAYVFEGNDDLRRLTPLECERLQGFPDGWTSAESDTARYRMMGNAVAVPVARWIGSRINTVHERLHS